MRSRWIFILFATGAVVTCTALGLWQLGRHSARSAANGLAWVARQVEPRIYPGGAYLAPDLRVIATGSFDHDHEFVLRGRSYDGAPGVEIATPFRMEGSDTAFIVIRGFVPSADAMSVDRGALREEGVRTIHGITFPLPLDGIPIVRNGDTTWSRIPGAWIQTAGNFPYPVHPYALWQERDSGVSGFPIRMGAPELSGGPHLSYAIQWFAFALIFAVGGVAYMMKKGQGTEVVP
jgi:surfeit locus 1 family protein